MNESTIREVTAETQRRAPGVTVRLKRLGRDIVIVQLISVPPSQRGLGMGQRVLDILCGWADREGVHLALSPSPHFGSDQRRLVAWYGRHGFTPTRAVPGQTMRRLHNGSAEARLAA